MWLASLENKLRKTDDNIVISDVRFRNEVKMLKELGAVCVEVTRGDRPAWYQYALDGDTKKLETLKVHRSEYDWVGTDFDATLDNNGSLDNLYKQVETLIGR